MDLAFIIQLLLWPLCLFIIGLILLQGGAGDLSSAFGGGGQLDSTLGVGAGRKMSKLTGWLSFFFMASIIFLARPHELGLKKALGDKAEQAATVPMTPSAAPAPTAPVTIGEEQKTDAQPTEAVVEIPPPEKAEGEKPAEPKNEAAPAPAENDKPATSSKPVLEETKDK